MPIHNWSGVSDGMFHYFHQRCIGTIAIGDTLTAMPLFLWADRYINVDLEQTYRSAWEVYPGPLKPKVESAATG